MIGRGPRRQATRAQAAGKTRLSVTVNSSYLSSAHARLSEEPEGWTIEDLSSRNGVFVNGQQVTRAALSPGDVVALGRVFFLVEYHEVALSSGDERGRRGPGPRRRARATSSGLLTLLPGLASRIGALRFEASRTSAITVVGETGTGKEVLARAIHRLSGRSGPYVAINCGAIPRELIQSELFGNVKGAFSGATGSPGYVRDAHQGTLLLDEIVASPPEVQVALLRVLQEKVVTPVGSTRGQPVDVRFVAAAQRPLAEAVAAGGFGRTSGTPGGVRLRAIAPARTNRRPRDLGRVCLLAAGVTEKDAPRLTPEAALRLLRYDWPLNVRELAQVDRASWARAKGGVIDESEMPKLKAPAAAEGASIEDQLRSRTCASTRGNVAETARRMGRARPLVHRWIKRFGIDPDSYRS